MNPRSTQTKGGTYAPSRSRRKSSRNAAGDGEIAAIVANTALPIFMNYFDHVAKPVVDFPKASVLAAL